MSHQERFLHRIHALIPLFLRGRIHRSELLGAMHDTLAEQGKWKALGEGEKDSASTFDRDVRFLKGQGLLRIQGRVYQAEPGPELPLWVTPAEDQALRMARFLLEQLGVPEARLMESLLGRVPQVGAKAQDPELALPPSLRSIQPKIWTALQEGLSQGRCMRLKYLPARHEQPCEPVLDRARLMWIGGAFYLCAFRKDLHRRELEAGRFREGEEHRYLRHYRLDRILDLTVLPEVVALAELPSIRVAFRLDAELPGLPGELVDERGRRVQRVEQLEDGSLRVELEETSLLRLRQRLLSYGRHLLEVEGPPELLEGLREEALALARRWAN